MSSGEEDNSDVLPTLDQLMSWKKKGMESWLVARGLPKSSKRKEILANRILRHMRGDDEDDLEDSDSDDDSGDVCHDQIPVCPGI